MTISDERLKELAMLSQATNPVFGADTTYTLEDGDPVPPSTGASMIDVSGLLYALVEVTLRGDPAQQVARVTIGTVTVGSVYHVTINGTDHNETADGADTQSTLAGHLTDAINAGAEADVVTATHPTDQAYLDIVGDVPDNFSISVSITGTAGGTISHTTDAQDIEINVWVVNKDRTVPHIPNGGDGIAVDHNWTERVSCAGLDRLLVLPAELDGDVVVNIGPCALET